MHRKRPVIIFGSVLIGSALAGLMPMLMSMLVFAQPLLPQVFTGDLNEGVDLAGDVQLGVKALDETLVELVNIPLTAGSVDTTAPDGTSAMQDCSV